MHMEIIVRNSAACLVCGDEIVSEHRHDFRSCRCGSLTVDGGQAYRRRLFQDVARWIDTSILAEQPATLADLEESRELLALANAGFRPKPETYANAPRLEEWCVVEARVPPAADDMQELEGCVFGHPEFRDGQKIRTTPLLIKSDHRSWARTMNRYWRLGTPAKGSLN